MNMAPLPPWSSGGVVVLFILWPMLSLAAYNSQGSPVVVLGMETPLVIIQSQRLTSKPVSSMPLGKWTLI